MIACKKEIKQATDTPPEEIVMDSGGGEYITTSCVQPLEQETYLDSI